MPPRTGRYGKVLKNVRDAIEMSRSGAVVINGGEAAIYFLWGQPSHAIFRDQDGEVEGMAALKAIAFSLNEPGGKVTWMPDQVVRNETLLINGDDLIATLEKLAAAPRQGPDAVERHEWDGRSRRLTDALEYDLADFPLLPAGAPLWADVPADVVHLDVLLQSLPTVLISFAGPGIRAACIVIHGQIVDGLYVDGTGSRQGAPAARALLSAPVGMVSAYEIDEVTAEALPLLWRSRVAYRDLDIRWIAPGAFLDALRADGADSAVIVSTPNAIGVALIRHGQVAATYSTDSPQPQPTNDLILGLFGKGTVGSVTVLEGVIGETVEAAPPVPTPAAGAPPSPVAVDVEEQKPAAWAVETAVPEPIPAEVASGAPTIDAGPAVSTPDPDDLTASILASLAPWSDSEDAGEDVPIGSEPSAPEAADSVALPSPPVDAVSVDPIQVVAPEAPAEPEIPSWATVPPPEPPALTPWDVPWDVPGEEPSPAVAESAAEPSWMAGAARAPDAAATWPDLPSAADPDAAWPAVEPTRDDAPGTPGFESAGGGDPASAPDSDRPSAAPFENAADPPDPDPGYGSPSPWLWDPEESQRNSGSAPVIAAPAEDGVAAGYVNGTEGGVEEGQPAGPAADGHDTRSHWDIRGAGSGSDAEAPLEENPPEGAEWPMPVGGHGGPTDVGFAPAPDPAPPGSSSPPPLFSFFNTDLSTGPSPPVAPPPRAPMPPSPGEVEADYDGVIEELEAIAIRFLGADAELVAEPIVQCPHTVAGLRTAITSLRSTEIPGHTPDDITEMTRAMLRAVADRLTAV